MRTELAGPFQVQGQQVARLQRQVIPGRAPGIHAQAPWPAGAGVPCSQSCLPVARLRARQPCRPTTSTLPSWTAPTYRSSGPRSSFHSGSPFFSARQKIASASSGATMIRPPWSRGGQSIQVCSGASTGKSAGSPRYEWSGAG